MASPPACLIDVYDTILTADFGAHRDVISVIAGISAQHWDAGLDQVEADLNNGRISRLQGIEHIRGGRRRADHPGVRRRHRPPGTGVDVHRRAPERRDLGLLTFSGALAQQP